MTPFGSTGGFHDTLMDVLAGEKSNGPLTDPGTVGYMYVCEHVKRYEYLIKETNIMIYI